MSGAGNLIRVRRCRCASRGHVGQFVIAGLPAAIVLFAVLTSRSAAQPPQEAAEPPAAEIEPQPPPDVTQTELPKLKDMLLPTADALLIEAPRDWIVLKNADVVVCEPIVPRPDTIVKRRAEIDAKGQMPRQVGRGTRAHSGRAGTAPIADHYAAGRHRESGVRAAAGADRPDRPSRRSRAATDRCAD
jgi:hypothetical protein